ncbi:MAG: glycosyltransferase [Candidatus Binatia bacterium]
MGFCLAVRAGALRAIGGWDEGFVTGGAEDDDLCPRLVVAGGRLVICHETFVHHHGHATFDGNGLDWFAIQQANVDRLVAKHAGRPRRPRRPGALLLYACLIVRDERDVLPDRLRALRGLADEVVVYDTGSADGSQEVARAAGARVVQGDWHDDFGRARNAALAHCAGEWVLHVDADEVFAGDPATLRAALDAAHVDAFAVEIVNLGGDGKHDAAHRACRVFRRELFHWQGRLHEQVVHRADGSDYPLAVLACGRLIHSGYTPERLRAKDKGARNVRLATLEAATEGDSVDAVVKLACSYTLADRPAEALALFARARALAGDSPPHRRRICRTAAQLCLSLGRPEAALGWIDDLASASASRALVGYLRGSACVALRRWREALDAYGGLGEVRDEDGVTLPLFVVRRDRARCHYMLGEWAAAWDEAARLAAGAACDEEIWPVLAVCAPRLGRDLAPLLDGVPDASLAAVFAQLLSLDEVAAPAILEPLLERPRYRAHVLALAIRLLPAMASGDAARWSARLRAVGLAEHCPP